MLQRSFTLLLMLPALASALAQVPFTYQFTSALSGASTSCLSFDRIGPDHYRIVGGMSQADTAWAYRAEMDANGMITNVSLIRPGIAGLPYPVSILNTADGGQLLNSFWADGATDKETFVRTDASGAVQWVRHYPDNFGIFLADGERNMVEKDAHYFVLGHGQDVPINTGWTNVLLELDSVGACVQLRTWAGDDAWSDLGRGIVRTASNGLMTVSVLRPYSSASTYPRLSVQRWNAAMQVEWSDHYSLGNYHFLNHVLHLQDDGLLLTGQIRFSSGFGTFHPYFLRLDSAGQVVWARVVLETQLSPKTAVEEPDGGFTVLCSDGTPQLIVARLDSAGAFITANFLDGLPTNAAPYDLSRDSVTGEHLVRARELGAVNLIYLMRLDSALTFGCGNLPFAWTDSLVTPQHYAYPATVTTGMLASYDTTWSMSMGSFSAVDPCLPTMISAAPQQAVVQAWPVPVEDELFIDPGQWTSAPVPYRIMDATGRCVQRGMALPTGDGALRVDVRALASGCHVLLLETPGDMMRVTVVK